MDEPSDATSSSDRPNDETGCPKCGHTEVDVGEISTTGSGLSKTFDNLLEM